jgi:hypothetical protein
MQFHLFQGVQSSADHSLFVPETIEARAMTLDDLAKLHGTWISILHAKQPNNDRVQDIQNDDDLGEVFIDDNPRPFDYSSFVQDLVPMSDVDEVIMLKAVIQSTTELSALIPCICFLVDSDTRVQDIVDIWMKLLCKGRSYGNPLNAPDLLYKDDTVVSNRLTMTEVCLVLRLSISRSLTMPQAGIILGDQVELRMPPAT